MKKLYSTLLLTLATIMPSWADGNVLVGSIDVNTTVTESGGAVVSIPIDIPSGTNAMQPNLALVYNSQGGQGDAGWGWNLSGLSLISRTGSVPYYDNKIDVVHFDSSDHLLLNGQRLILDTGNISNLTSGATYYTEVESFNKVTFISETSGFTVQSKDGTIATYGDTCSSRLANSSIDSPMAWYVTKTVDTSGNYVKYKYTSSTNPNEVHINCIEYTGNTNGTNPNKKVSFEYDILPNPLVQYVSGKAFRQSKMLKKIHVFSNNTELYYYQLNYDIQGIHPILTSINKYASNQDHYNAVSVEWSSSQVGSVESRTFYAPNGMYFLPPSIRYGDFNGDGKQDFITYSTNSNVAVLYINHSGTENSSFTQHKILFNDDISEIEVLDYDGNGSKELFITFDTGSSFSNSIYYWSGTVMLPVTLSPASALNRLLPTDRNSFLSIEQNDSATNTEARSENVRLNSLNFLRPIAGDFDGDGRDELVLPLYGYILDLYDQTCYEYTGIDWQHLVGFPYVYNRNCVPVDFNGNGKADIFMRTDTQIFIYEYDEAYHRFNTLCAKSYSALNMGESNFENFSLGDYNGDGNTDILCTWESPNQYIMSDWKARILFSTGSDFIVGWEEYGGEFNYSCDVNNDGLTDYCFYTPGIDGALYLGINNGCGFTYTTLTVPNTSSLSTQDIFFMDVFGDGRNSLIYYHVNGNTADYHCLRMNKQKPFMLRKITNGLGAEYSFSYEPVSNSSIYSSSFSATDNLLPLKSALYVVSSYKAPYTSLHYSYEDGRIHKKGKGFLGFMKTIVTDSLNQRRQESNNLLDETFYYIKPHITRVKGFNGTTISEATYTLDRMIYANGRYWPYISIAVNKDCLTTLSDTIFNTYDTKGNLTQQINARGSQRTTTNLTYGNYASWCNNKLVHSETRYRLGNEESPMRQLDFWYDAQGRLKRQVEDSISSGHKLEKIFTYDSYGNVLKSRIVGGNQSRTTTTVYSNNGRYPISVSDALGMTTTFSYNATTEYLTSETDCSGTTTYEYDAFGRLKLTAYPDGVEHATMLSYVYGNTDAKYCVNDFETDSPETYTWYNNAGRPICKAVLSFNDEYTYMVTRYNANGAVSMVSEPRFDSSYQSALRAYYDTDNATIYTYDVYGRTSKIQSPSVNNQYTYSGLSTSIRTKEGYSGTTLTREGWIDHTIMYDEQIEIDPFPFDPHPLLMAPIHRSNKTVRYSYYPSGKIRAIVPQGGDSILFEYDIQGNRTYMKDPDAGVITSEFNALGQLINNTQTIDSNPIRTEYTYETNGRLKRNKTCGQTDISRSYAYSTTFKNYVSSISTGTTNRCSYTFDNLGRITYRRTKIQGKETVDRFVYDGSLLSMRKYNNLLEEYYEYDNYGNVIRERLGNTPTWELLEVNARGQVVRERKGNIITTYGYDNSGRLVSEVAPGIVSLHYTYDDAGNVITKTDSLSMQKATYTYDGKNRLTSWKNIRLLPLRMHPPTINDSLSLYPFNGYAIEYNDTTGLIRKKTDLGANVSLLYQDTIHSHALSEVTGVSSNWGNEPINIAYTDFNKTDSIVSNGIKYQIYYLPNNNRGASERTKNNKTSTRYYYDSSEIFVDTNGVSTNIAYLCHGAIAIKRSVDPSVTLLQGYYDAQGSLIALVDTDGNVIRRYAYDPWGKRVNPNDWYKTDTLQEVYHIVRGYTMHEHLDDFELINMNGRVYDPAVAQFLSPDNYIQDDGNWLNYNRYAYCINNPLKYDDPSGEVAQAVVGAVIGGSINVILHFDDINSARDFLVAFGVGAVAGAVGSLIGGAAFAILDNGAGGFIGGAINGAVNTAFSSPINSIGNALYFGDEIPSIGDYCKEIMLSGITSGISNGVNALAHDRDFMTGALNVADTRSFPALSVQKTIQVSQNAYEQELPTSITIPDDLLSSSTGGNVYELDFIPPMKYRPESGLSSMALPDKYRSPRFRAMLISKSGVTPDASTAEAHHVFPVTFGREFRKVGIEPNNYGAWWTTHEHRINSKAYNEEWRRFFMSEGYTRESCFKFLQELKTKYHF